MLVVTYFILPETKSYSLEGIAEVFEAPGAVGQVSMSCGLKGDFDEVGEVEHAY